MTPVCTLEEVAHDAAIKIALAILDMNYSYKNSVMILWPDEITVSSGEDRKTFNFSKAYHGLL